MESKLFSASMLEGRFKSKVDQILHVYICITFTRTPADLDARRDRYECKISTFPPTDGIMQLVERVAIEMQRSNVVFSAITTSGTFTQ